MTYKGYKAEITFDSDANTLYGEILNSSAVIHFRGNSIEELEKSFQEGIDEYLLVCEVEGITPERPFSGEFRVRISPDLHKKIFFQAKKEKLSINKFAIKAFKEKLINSGKEGT
jgi:predicted HicB family RNase H-like nuclease